MTKKIDPSKLDVKAVERLARLNREKSIEENKKIKEDEEGTKKVKDKKKSKLHHEYEDARAQKFFNEMKERDF